MSKHSVDGSISLYRLSCFDRQLCRYDVSERRNMAPEHASLLTARLV